MFSKRILCFIFGHKWKAVKIGGTVRPRNATFCFRCYKIEVE